MVPFHCLKDLCIKNRLKKKEKTRKTELKEFTDYIIKYETEGINKKVFK